MSLAVASAALASTRADFRIRRRGPAYLVMLVGSVLLGLLAAPPRDAAFQVLELGPYRGEFTTGYLAAVTAMAGGLWLSFAGFAAVRGALARDEAEGVAELVASTSRPTASHLLGRFGGAVLVLLSGALVLLGTAVAIQLLRGESTRIDPVALLLPLAVVELPLLLLAAGAAVLWDTVRPLRGAAGAALWFVVWMVLVIGGQSGRGLDLLGMGRITRSLRDAVVAQGDDPHRMEFGVGLTMNGPSREVVHWAGLPAGSWLELVPQAVALAALALALVLAPCAWYRLMPPRPAGRAEAAQAAQAAQAARFRTAGLGAPPPALDRPFPLLAEVRLLLLGQPWWWLPLLALTAVAAGFTAGAAPAVWIALMPAWSRLGVPAPSPASDIVAACPSPGRRRLATVLAGLAVTVAASAPAALRNPSPTWEAVTLGLAALALACNAATRSPRLFQALFPPLWYLIVAH
ncbi:hypothetical protein BIV57_19925 [Mangrovactinospora gilvigrisea]|uniref:Uncharacterized protein n=1 Tax=Mangrovactinospora gilvigrisea TaxID=1428644 RepID=A0A1J7C7X8_9ACTN|nr:hypothetical protein [Mangrovactinospora gilvigrisea]OIV35746.1 hypothetical protein BIV57_19925 [Mangrovactinospora gilvigrisea]